MLKSSKLIVNKGNFANIFIFAVISSSSTQSYSEVQAVACKIVNGSSLHQHFREVDAHCTKKTSSSVPKTGNMMSGIFETDLLHSDAPILSISG